MFDENEVLVAELHDRRITAMDVGHLNNEGLRITPLVNDPWEKMVGSDSGLSLVKHRRHLLESLAISNENVFSRERGTAILVGETSGLFAVLELNDTESSNQILGSAITSLEKIAKDTPDPNIFMLGGDNTIMENLLFTELNYFPEKGTDGKSWTKKQQLAFRLSIGVINQLATRSPKIEMFVKKQRKLFQEKVSSFSSVPNEALAALKKHSKI